MADLFDRWQKYRVEKNDTNRKIGGLSSFAPLTPEQEWLIQRYNLLYALMYDLQDQFADEDWAAYDAEQEEFRQAERQQWLIKDRYGDSNPAHGIADWWTAKP